jgi:hypothetical protein
MLKASQRHYRFLIISSAFLFSTGVFAANTPNNDNPNTFIGPFFRGSFTNFFTSSGAFSAAAEVGSSNNRLSGNLAWHDEGSQRFKLSAEWLAQNISYAFFSGNSSQWMNQTAVGGNYRYYFEDYYYEPEAGMDAYFAHSSSKSLRTDSGSYISSTGVSTPFVNAKRIAGASAFGLAPGASFQFWPGGRLGAKLNYDNVNYDNIYVASKDAKGFGGTVLVNQALSDSVTVGAQAALLNPYNDYQANVTFGNISFYGMWSFGVSGNYTIGKYSMPDTYNIGFSADYMLDQSHVTSFAARAATEDFLAWTSKPAVYAPQIFSLADQSVR